MLIASRRAFLRQILFAAEPVVADPGGHTLVCVFLRGGADTLNIVVPFGDADYYRNRPTLAIAEPKKAGDDAAIGLTDFFGFHPKMSPLFPLFKEGRLGIVNAVGSDDQSGSHFEAQDQIEHGEGFGRQIGGGWLGRHLRSRIAGGDSPLAAVAIGPTLPESLRGAPAAASFESVDEIQLPTAAGKSSAVAKALSKMYATRAGVLGDQGKQTLQLLDRVEQLRGKPYKPEAGVDYPKDEFGKAMMEVARLIKAGLGLEAACVDLGNWDTHFFQGLGNGLQSTLINSLAQGLAAFDADMATRRDQVTTIVMTEFGRRLYENGSAGTDHGRGFAMMALGGRIAGGKILGDWPGLTDQRGIPAVPGVAGPGGLEVKVDYRSILAEVLTDAVGSTQTARVFPDFKPAPVGLVKRSVA
ncbi:DUF1501 domain-containing protein [Humisphaera borealis]|uniref:DUF1501 domain-containing protein n=1 Tax=Humisphaera borealis TaxID=2807512 RepID=A0A7M2WUF0_9BACT|nr:DUF1501 domain-containing protein [Humisphaera borealis]QOV88160.1 DUF1501 domain-containing protein [Humisphaera borealis]